MRYRDMDLLLIEDDESFAFSVAEYVTDRGYNLTVVNEGRKGVDEAKKGYGCILLDLGLPDVDGIKLIPKLRELSVPAPIIVLTGRDDASTAVEAIRSGAYDYITKPVDLEELVLTLTRAEAMLSLQDKISFLEAKEEFVLIGQSKPIGELKKLINKVSPHNTPVLIVGETGVGKEVVARLIHKASGRKGNFVDINCSAIPRDLFEGELFGFKAGSFTGAVKSKKGLAQWADGGTLFFDEIGDLPLELQPKLLRVVERGEVRALGEGQNIRVDVRIIAATNSEPEAMLTQGRLRQDLYFRLSTFLIPIPPLRERKEDILVLGDYFIREFSQKMRRTIKEISPEVRDAFFHYHWPGNVRELKNMIERGVIMCDEGVLDRQHLPLDITPPLKEFLPLQEIEKEHISAALNRFQGNVARTAKALQIPRTTLRDKIRELGIQHKP
jgi:two-component system NtrC family response regulator